MNKKTQPSSNRLLTLDEVAGYLRLSTHTLYKMAQQERIPAFKVANQWRFKKDEIDTWIERSRKRRQK